MRLTVHTSARTEDLLRGLAQTLEATWPSDPMQPVAVMVGSRAMERWLRHQLAKHGRDGIAAGLEFPLVGDTLEGATQWILDGCQADNPYYWRPKSAPGELWGKDATTLAIVQALRARAEDPRFSRVRAYLGSGEGPVADREFQFARQVSGVLDRLAHDRPEVMGVALPFGDAHDEVDRERHGWLGALYADLREILEASDPATLFRRLQERAAQEENPEVTGVPALHVFGLSTLGRGQLMRLALLARFVPIEMWLLLPSGELLDHIRSERDTNRALFKARTADAIQDVLDERARTNTVLARLGQPSIYVQSYLVSEGVLDQWDSLSEHPAPHPATRPPTLLERLQGWIGEAAENREGAEPGWEVDGSIRFHSAHGPMRQVEVLREQILGLLEGDPTLTPRDILVMTPDVATFAPLVQALFARTDTGAQENKVQGVPALPIEVSDLGLKAVNGVAQTLVALMELATERVTVSRMLEFLQLGPVRLRFGIETEDVPALQEMVLASGMRWGLDAADRADHNLPATRQNTVGFAMDRLALGVLMPEGTALIAPETAADTSSEPRGLVPVAMHQQERVALMGKWMALVQALAFHRQRLQGAHAVAQWTERMQQALLELVRTSATTGFLMQAVNEKLEAFRAAAGERELAIEAKAMRRWLEEAFDGNQKLDRGMRGAIQVCAMEPMRTVPFRVVALLGMDDGLFPRSRQFPGWDPMARPVRGERDVRANDRHMLLEALLSAREHLLVLWTGEAKEAGKHLAACVPIEELIDTIAHQADVPREALIARHPLQPWSELAFLATNGDALDSAGSFSPSMAEAARRLQSVRTAQTRARSLALASHFTDPLRAEDEPRVLSGEQFARGLVNPAKLLLGDRLALVLDRRTQAQEDREPLELDHLQSWKVRRELLDELMSRPVGLEVLQDDTEREAHIDRVVQVLAGRGELPLQAGGRKIVADERELALRALEEAHEVQGQLVKHPRWTHRVGRLTLNAQAHMARQTEQGLVVQWLISSKVDGSAPSRGAIGAMVSAWVQLLVARAQNPSVIGAQLAPTSGKSRWLRAPDADQAQAILDDLAALWWQARSMPLPLFASTSHAFATLLKDGATSESVIATSLDQLEKAWSGNDFPKGSSKGDSEDPWVQRLYAGSDLRDLLAPCDAHDAALLALRLWEPLLDHVVNDLAALISSAARHETTTPVPAEAP